MNKKDVIEHFGGSARNVAEAIKVSTQYVSQWPTLVPESMAARLDRLTDGKLQYNPDVYIQEHARRRNKK